MFCWVALVLPGAPIDLRHRHAAQHGSHESPVGRFGSGPELGSIALLLVLVLGILGGPIRVSVDDDCCAGAASSC